MHRRRAGQNRRGGSDIASGFGCESATSMAFVEARDREKEAEAEAEEERDTGTKGWKDEGTEGRRNGRTEGTLSIDSSKSLSMFPTSCSNRIWRRRS